jgi:hypothetical protein
MKHFKLVPTLQIFFPGVETTPKKKSRAANSNHHPKSSSQELPFPQADPPKHHFFNSARIQVKNPAPDSDCAEIKQNPLPLDAGSAR